MSSKSDVEHGNTSSYLASGRKRWAVRRSFTKPFVAISAALLIATSCVIGLDCIGSKVSSQNSSALIPSILLNTRKLQAEEEEVDVDRLKVGVADLEDVGELEQKIKAKFDLAVKFQDIKTLKYDYHIKPLLDNDQEVVIVMEFFSDNKTNLVDIIRGDYDDYMGKFAADWKRDGGKELNIRPLHEMNGDWYPWGTFLGGDNTQDNFILAFRHIHEYFSRQRVSFKMQLAYNCENPNDIDAEFGLWFPGEDYVDMILCSAYNRAFTSQWHTEWESFEEVFTQGYEKMATLSETIPLGVGETSTVSEGGDKVQWIRDAFTSLQTTFPRVKEVDFFLINKKGAEEGDWGLNGNAELYAFGDEINELKGFSSAPTSAPTPTPTGPMIKY